MCNKLYMSSRSLQSSRSLRSWNTFTNHFPEIIRDTSHKTILDEIIDTPNNILLYSVHGFPIDLFIDEILKSRFNIQTIYRNKALWNKNIPYIENQYFFEVDLMNPELPKDYSFLTELILHIVKMRNITNSKHLFIIKHIELLRDYFFEFRILLERYSSNVVFLCTTHSISHIEAPIRSRFNLFRIPLFTTTEIQNIFAKYLYNNMLNDLLKVFRRNIIKAIFFADMTSTTSLDTYNFPPLYDFMKTYDKKKNNLEEIRTLAYKCCQYSISIGDLAQDFIRILDDNIDFAKLKKSRISQKKYIQTKEEYKCKIINIAADLDHSLCLTNKGREPIYIEAFLCQIIC